MKALLTLVVGLLAFGVACAAPASTPLATSTVRSVPTVATAIPATATVTPTPTAELTIEDALETIVAQSTCSDFFKVYVPDHAIDEITEVRYENPYWITQGTARIAECYPYAYVRYTFLRDYDREPIQDSGILSIRIRFYADGAVESDWWID